MFTARYGLNIYIKLTLIKLIFLCEFEMKKYLLFKFNKNILICKQF